MVHQFHFTTKMTKNTHNLNKECKPNKNLDILTDNKYKPHTQNERIQIKNRTKFKNQQFHTLEQNSKK
ncbi:hypothetical protein Hanom_Chr12g01079581 [Helianthus anomalus]